VEITDDVVGFWDGKADGRRGSRLSLFVTGMT
jgi:hypothetical protein